MSRSSRKGPYIDPKLLAKVKKQITGGKNEAIKTWARACQIPPEFVGFTFKVHTGKDFKDTYITEAMVGHRLGEFAPTRKFIGHGQIVKRLLEKT
ncbi:MAG: Ribosomal protein S19 [Microgenomates group bacterium GW2011_GWA1_Microgenomates_45_10]|nr:MAG: Ribosomal protein S19 [Microgenomates group bacterium GW2011_GWA2_44_7]KKT78072.1 MAG: Ribosomal protein S19 [Microgenomates group bacterium GW2011_GWB1_44_8]KKT87409.1 MAG: Ribosomal protein S19 [Microgenomates group bacterium GW2011_GWA1_Microgenomates_45_10]